MMLPTYRLKRYIITFASFSMMDHLQYSVWYHLVYYLALRYILQTEQHNRVSQHLSQSLGSEGTRSAIRRRIRETEGNKRNDPCIPRANVLHCCYCGSFVKTIRAFRCGARIAMKINGPAVVYVARLSQTEEYAPSYRVLDESTKVPEKNVKLSLNKIILVIFCIPVISKMYCIILTKYISNFLSAVQ